MARFVRHPPNPQTGQGGFVKPGAITTPVPKAVNAPRMVNFTGVPEGMGSNPYYGLGQEGIEQARSELANVAGFPLAAVKEPFGGAAYVVDKLGTNLRDSMAMRAEAATRDTLASLMGGIDPVKGPTMEQVAAAYQADPAMGEKLYAQLVAASNQERWEPYGNGLQRNTRTGEIKDAGTAQGPGSMKNTDIAAMYDDYNNVSDVKNYGGAQSMWVSMQDAATRDTAQADLNMVIAAAKMFDPTSVVRSEEGKAVELTGDLPSSVAGAFAYLTGKQGARLSRKTRQGLMQEAFSRMNGYYRGVKEAETYFTDKARRWGVNPADVVRPFTAPVEFDLEKVVGSDVTEDTPDPPEPPAQPDVVEPGQPDPSQPDLKVGDVRPGVDGVKWRYKGGKWNDAGSWEKVQ